MHQHLRASVLDNKRASLPAWQDRVLDPSLTVLLVLQVFLVRGAVDPRPGLSRIWRTGRCLGADRKLSRLSDRYYRLGPDGARHNQAQKFGAEMAIPDEVGRLQAQPDADYLMLALANAEKVRARPVVIASGARYRRLNVQNLASFEEASVHYWASPLEAQLCGGQEVALVGDYPRARFVLAVVEVST